MSKARVAPKAPAPQRSILPDVDITFTRGGRSWTTTGSKLALAFYRATAGPKAQRERACSAAEGVLEAVCQATLAAAPSDRFAMLTHPPAPLPLAGLTFTTSPGGRTFTGAEIEQLLSLASETNGGVRGLTSAEDVNMALRGLGALCQYAGETTAPHEDDEHVLWFLGDSLAALAARLEAATSPSTAATCVVAHAKAVV